MLETQGFPGDPIFPVIYDDERYDAFLLMAISFMRLMGSQVLNPDAMSHIKCSLHKAKLWEYEKEWRLLDYTFRDPFTASPRVIHYCPTAIYYGAKLPLHIKEQLHEIAQNKKVTEYEMYIDYSSPKYEMNYKLYNNV